MTDCSGGGDNAQGFADFPCAVPFPACVPVDDGGDGDGSSNAGLSFTSGTTSSAPENQTGTGYTAQSEDPEGDIVTYSLVGGVDVGAFSIDADARALPSRSAGLLTAGNAVRVQAGAEGARLLLLSGRPLNEPVVRQGPFVMSTREEIERALADCRDGQPG